MAALLALALTTGAAPGVAPWTEAVVSVTDIAATTRVLREVGGWSIRARGRVSPQEVRYWRLPAGARGDFERLCAPRVETGCLRFVRWTGVEQRPIRRAARAWDTGGIYSIMVRTDALQTVYERALAMGWWAESEPIDFTFGGSTLRNVVLTGPQGINLALYERVSPPFTAFPVGAISQAFNTMRMVRSKPAARNWFAQKLGFGLVFDSAAAPKVRARSNFGIPLNYTTTAWRNAAALVPVPSETGRVEVMQIDGFEGSDLSAHALPQNLGIVSVRFPVTGLDRYRGELGARGVAIAYEARGVPVGGLGRIDLFAVRDPDGAITEFYEASR
jgi:catechol 2,3-dioxygenase-like lactoylglutathione lyase family enzyme